jgi:hypothetical protein
MLGSVVRAARSADGIQEVPGLLVIDDVPVRRSEHAHIAGGRCNGPPHEFEEETADPAVALASKLGHRLGLVSVGDDDAPWSSPHTTAHVRDRTF